MVNEITPPAAGNDLIQLFRFLWSSRKILVKAVIIGFVIGLIIAISIPKEFTCTVKMAPEGSKSSIPGNISGLAAIAGISLGADDIDGINLSLYPDVIQSTPFVYELMSIPVKPAKSENAVSLYYYLDRKIRDPWFYTALKSPFMLLDLIRYGRKNPEAVVDPYHLSRRQDKVFRELKSRMVLSIDKKTGVITGGITMQEPQIAALVADSVIAKLQRFVIDYRTNKAKQDLEYAAKMYKEAKNGYYEAQKNYASYIDRNRNLILESVRIEEERLKNEEMLAYNVYSGLAQQLETAKMKVQEQTPCITVIEPASIPARKSNTSKALIILIFGIGGFCFSAIRLMYLHQVRRTL